MSFVPHKFTVQDDTGAIAPGSQVEVRRTAGGALAALFSDNGVTGLSNPFNADITTAEAEFFTAPDRYTITVTGGGNTSEKIIDLVDARQNLTFASRANAVAWIAGGGSAPDGAVMWIGVPAASTLAFVAESGSGATPNMGGWVPYGDFTADHMGAIGDGVTDDTTAITLAVAYALANDQRILWRRDYLTTATIPDLHNVRHDGPGTIVIGSSTFPMDPKKTSAAPYLRAPVDANVTNALYVDAASGSNSNDGLGSGARAVATLGQAFNIMANYGSILDGLWKIEMAAGTFTAANIAGRKFVSFNPIWIEGALSGAAFSEPTTIIDGVDRTTDGIELALYQSLYLKDVKTTRCANGVKVSQYCYIKFDNVWSEDDSVGRTVLEHSHHSSQGGAIKGALNIGIQEIFNCSRSYDEDSSNYTVIDGEGVTPTGFQMKECGSGHLDFLQVHSCTEVEVELQSQCTANVGGMRLGGGATASPVGLMVANSEIHDFNQVEFNAVNPPVIYMRHAGTGTVTDQYGWTGDASALNVGIPAPILIAHEAASVNITSAAGADQEVLSVTLRQGYSGLPGYACKIVGHGEIVDNGAGGATAGTLQFRPRFGADTLTGSKTTIPAGLQNKDFKFEINITIRAAGDQAVDGYILVDGENPIAFSDVTTATDTGVTPIVMNMRRSASADVFTFRDVKIYG